MDNDNRRARFKDAGWYNNNQKLDISIIGLGGIGSWLSVLLSRIGDHNFYIYDFDTIEEHNLGGQMYDVRRIGEYKSSITTEQMELYSGATNINSVGKFTKDSMVTPYMFTPLDNMDVRKLAFDKWVEEYGNSAEDCLFTDLRMQAESLEVYFVTKDRIEDYKKELFPDSEINEQPCSYKATSHCGAMCATLAVTGFTNHLFNLYQETDIRELPFKLRVDLPFFQFNLNETLTAVN